MNTQQIDEKAVFNAARRIADLAARDKYLAQACVGDESAIQRIRELLRIHEQEQSFLESPAAAYAATMDQSHLSERPGTIIGPYKLLQQIGEGGMGIVFMAEQTEPIQRTVALKIIKPSMDTRQVVARFEAERQALAMMDHPNISKVLDAGTTATGRPYFVMDIVKGVPITGYCDQQHLSVRQRLELMTQVCNAVQHAHQKGIIHRDIKPSNVLVAEYDGRPVPKVIDFGVAKATAQRLTERTLFTEYGQLIGTFEYMSPEQARFNQLDVDTRSDIYSLGVMLYELLAGSTPLEPTRLRAAALDEILRMIGEEEPPRPSTRLSSSESLPSVAASRNLEPKRLTGLIHGALDWIVMRCLAKDRNARYASAVELSADLEHWLRDEPVSVRDPDPGYLLRMWVRKNLGAGGWAVALGLIWGTLLGVLFWIVMFEMSDVSQLVRRLILALGMLLGAFAGPITIWLVRPKNVAAELIAGLISGTLAAVVCYTISLGWAAVTIVGVPYGIWLGMAFALVCMGTTCVVGTLAAGMLLRRYGAFRRMLAAFTELVIPSTLLIGLVSGMMWGIAIQWMSLGYYIAPVLTIGLAITGALARWSWPLRLVLHVVWMTTVYFFLKVYLRM